MAHFTPHQDMVTSLEMCVRNERTLILSASSDCSVGLWDIYGNQIGTFGQVGVQYFRILMLRVRLRLNVMYVCLRLCNIML